MKLYVAGPMTGIPEFNYPAFRAAADTLRSLGFDALNPADIDELHNPDPEPQDWDWYMRHALRMVLDSDGVALLDGWRASKGATLEVEVATALRMPVKPYSQWVAEEPS